MDEVWNNTEKAFKVLKSLSESKLFEKGKTRLNIAGGEPVLNMSRLGPIIDFASELGFKLSIITNGSHIENLLPYIKKFSLIGISVDSTDDDTNRKISRCTSDGTVMPFSVLFNKINLLKAENPGLRFKFNTVANQYNWNENIIGKFQVIKAEKYKLLRQLPFKENKGISDEEWDSFLKNNIRQGLNIITEDNEEMTQSYLMIAPDGRFFQNGDGNYKYSSCSLSDAPADLLLDEIKFDYRKFKTRYLSISARNQIEY